MRLGAPFAAVGYRPAAGTGLSVSFAAVHPDQRPEPIRVAEFMHMHRVTRTPLMMPPI